MYRRPMLCRDRCNAYSAYNNINDDNQDEAYFSCKCIRLAISHHSYAILHMQLRPSSLAFYSMQGYE